MAISTNYIALGDLFFYFCDAIITSHSADSFRLRMSWKMIELKDVIGVPYTTIGTRLTLFSVAQERLQYSASRHVLGTSGEIRTRTNQFRRLAPYPLDYGGMVRVEGIEPPRWPGSKPGDLP